MKIQFVAIPSSFYKIFANVVLKIFKPKLNSPNLKLLISPMMLKEYQILNTIYFKALFAIAFSLLLNPFGYGQSKTEIFNFP
ncbi:MAG: hypothetical protein DRJ05_14745, partial [Bacteroidetes bacterium]